MICHFMHQRAVHACLMAHQAPATESEMNKAAADHSTLCHANQLLQEEKDEVKRMNQMVHYAKCMSVRDKQVQV